MSQDIIADVLNELMNAKKSGKHELLIAKSSRLLEKLLEIMKNYGYIDYESEGGKTKILFKELNKCKAIKPRYTVKSGKIEKYTRRFLPARNFGYVIISTSRGLMTQQEARENKIGGSLIAYFY